MIRIKIKSSVLETLDGSQRFKSFTHEGSTYVIGHEEVKPFPDEAARAWLASDSDLEIQASS